MVREDDLLDGGGVVGPPILLDAFVDLRAREPTVVDGPLTFKATARSKSHPVLGFDRRQKTATSLLRREQFDVDVFGARGSGTVHVDVAARKRRADQRCAQLRREKRTARRPKIFRLPQAQLERAREVEIRWIVPPTVRRIREPPARAEAAGMMRGSMADARGGLRRWQVARRRVGCNIPSEPARWRVLSSRHRRVGRAGPDCGKSFGYARWSQRVWRLPVLRRGCFERSKPGSSAA